MIPYEITTEEATVLVYLKNMRKYSPENFKLLICYTVRADTLIKFLEDPDSFGDHDFVYVGSIFKAIRKLAKNYLLPFPEIEEQTEEDRVISKLLRKGSVYYNCESEYISKLVNINHVIKYMERNPEIYDWNSYLIIRVQQEVKRVKEKLL